MSSVVSIWSTRTAKPIPKRRRSTSVSAMSRVTDNNRIPAIQMKDERDVATLVCIEISRAMLLAPGADIKTFLRTASDSRRDINISDATVIISVCILEHIGNVEMAQKLLSKSRTLTNFYDQMGLNNVKVRAMMVTMLFALNPGFVEMLERCLIIAIERSASQGRKSSADSQVSSAMSTLTLEGAMSPFELNKSLKYDDDSEISLAPEARRNSIQRTPTEMIRPDDSVSVVKGNRAIEQRDLLTFAKRRMTGEEQNFKEVFRSAEQPIADKIPVKNNRHGVGYVENDRLKAGAIDSMNRILGSLRTKHIDQRTGAVEYRQPDVMDFLESENVSISAMRHAPDVRSDYTSGFYKEGAERPYPTEFTLPTSVTYQSGHTAQIVNKKTSAEVLKELFG
jgi:hypothetical protein